MTSLWMGKVDNLLGSKPLKLQCPEMPHKSVLVSVTHLTIKHVALILRLPPIPSSPERIHGIPRNIFTHTCFIPPNGSALTADQSIPASNCSSTSPQIATLSPRIKYNPCSTCCVASSDPGVAKMRSMVWERMRLVVWS